MQIYPKIKEQNDKKFHTLTYLGPMSERISKILSSDNVKIVFKSSNRLSNLIFNVKDKFNVINIKSQEFIK